MGLEDIQLNEVIMALKDKYSIVSLLKFIYFILRAQGILDACISVHHMHAVVQIRIEDQVSWT